MIFLGHLAVTLVATQTYNRLARARIDLRQPAFFSILPDLIDKPLAFALPEYFGHNTKLYAHSLLFCVALLPLMLILRKKLKAPIACWLALLGHLVLDREWNGFVPVLFWPFHGTQPPQPPIAMSIFGWTSFQPSQFYFEFAGLVVLIGFGIKYRLYRWDRLVAVFRTGYLE